MSVLDVAIGTGLVARQALAITQDRRAVVGLDVSAGMLDEVRGPIASEKGTEGREAERAMEHAAVRVSLENLRTFPCIRRSEREGHLQLRGAFFAISDGVLHLLDEPSGVFSPMVQEK